MVYVLVNVDESRASFDFDRCVRLIEVDDFVHATHVEQRVAVIQCQIAIPAAGATSTDGHPVACAISERFAALLECRWTSDERMRADRSDQRFDVFPSHEIEGLLDVLSCHRRTRYPG